MLKLICLLQYYASIGISTQYFTYTSTVRTSKDTSSTVNRDTASGKTSSTVSISSITVSPLQSSTISLEEKTTECSDNLTTGDFIVDTLLYFHSGLTRVHNIINPHCDKPCLNIFLSCSYKKELLLLA